MALLVGHSFGEESRNVVTVFLFLIGFYVIWKGSRGFLLQAFNINSAASCSFIPQLMQNFFQIVTEHHRISSAALWKLSLQWSMNEGHWEGVTKRKVLATEWPGTDTLVIF